MVDIYQPENSYRLTGGQIAIDAMGRVWMLNKESKGEAVKLTGYAVPPVPPAAESSSTGKLILSSGSRVRLEVSAIVHDATPQLYRQIRENFSKEMKAPFSGSGSPFDPPNRSDKPSVEKTEIPSYDATAEATVIVQRLVEEAGYIVDPDAEFTLHVELAHPSKTRKMYSDQDPDGIHGYSMLSKFMVPSWALRLQFYLLDKEGQFVSRAVVHEDIPLGPGTEENSPMFRSSTKILEQLTIPRKFIQMPIRSATLQLEGGKIRVVK